MRRTMGGLLQAPPSHRAAVLVLLALAFAAVTPAWSQTYPDRPVKLVTQGAAGTGSDVIARLVTDHLARMWGQQIVVLNQPGAGGSAAARVAATAAPDGYTLYVAGVSTFIAMHEMFPNLPFSVDRDFARIAMMGELPMMLAASPSLGVNTLAELIALSKTRPILYAGNSRGTFANLTVERLRQETGADFSFVPYPGATAALQDLIGGRISMMCEAPSAFLGPVQAGSVKLLAVASPKRLPNFPDVPTIAETVPGFTAMAWLAVLAPTGTPEPIIRKVNADLNQVYALPEIAQRLRDIGTYTRPLSPAETAEFITSEQRVWIPVVRQVGVTR
jgi:tripartite-type tricarboxylate transporter receptor subunit TctC